MNSMVEVLAEHARVQPDRLFVVDNEGTAYSYRQAWEAIKTVAANLTDRYGVKAGERVMVECNQNAGYLLVDLACQLVGAVFVPVENGASPERKQTIFMETESILWVYESQELEFARSVLQGDLLKFQGNSNSGDSFPCGERTAEILYTTGTTGTSKGIVISNRANVALAENIREGVQMCPGNTELIPLPISHSHGLRCCYANLLNGGTIVLIDGLLRVKDAFRLIETYHVTAMDLSPSAASLLIKLSKGAFWGVWP